MLPSQSFQIATIRVNLRVGPLVKPKGFVVNSCIPSFPIVWDHKELKVSQLQSFPHTLLHCSVYKELAGYFSSFNGNYLLKKLK